jgi:branched-chain amino acid transport system substrate-binding protein
LACSVTFAQAQPVVVGAVVSQSGAHASLAAGYRNGLALWQDEVNAAGGLLGRKVELRLLDDASDAVQSGRLYAQLIAQKADALIGPYGSAATLMAGAEAEKAQRVMLNAAGPARAVDKRAGGYVFRVGAPYTAHGASMIELAKAQGIRQVLIVARDDATSREMAEGARETATKVGLAAGEIVVHRPGSADFAPQVEKARAAGAEAWIAFGEVRDAADMVRSFRQIGYAPRMVFTRAAADPGFIKLVGQDAEHTLAAREYDPRFATPGNAAFVAAFAKKFSAAPGTAAAQAYAAGTVLAEAARRAGSLDQEKLKAALAASQAPTVLGAAPAVAQIQKGRPEIVWPEALRTAALQPYPQWNERKVLKR